MKKLKLFSFIGLGILSMFGILLGATHSSNVLPVYAEDEITEPEIVEEEYECLVSWDSEQEHGKISVDKDKGHVGDIVTITLEPNLFYLTESVKVNGTSLVEDEDIKDLYKFSLVEGKNTIEVKFAIDQELFGELSGVVNQAIEGDWTSVFTLRNLVAVISFILNGGLLIAIVRYYVKDKRLEKKVEEKVESTVKEVVPETTKQIVLETIQNLVGPYFAKIEATNEDIQNMLVVFCRCFALAQENTPESRIAITKELASLKLSDKSLIADIQNRINDFIKSSSDKVAEILLKLNNMQDKNKEIIEGSDNSEDTSEEPIDNGIQI